MMTALAQDDRRIETTTDRPIPQTDPREGYLAQQAEIDAAVARVLAGGAYISGPEVAAFEAAFARHIGVAHAVGVGNGTDAIELALRACDIGAGDLVYTVSHTAVATVAAIERAGAIPVLIDIEPDFFTMDPEALDRALRHSDQRGRPAAILPVHLYGQPAALDSLRETARTYGLQMIEDCAQSHGASYRGQVTGGIGDAGCFSFYPTKNLGGFGDGGMVVTGDAARAQALREIREYGWRERYVSARIGINTRLDPIQAAILGVKLQRLPQDNAQRQRIATRYDDGLAGLPLILPARRAAASHVFHQYVVRLPGMNRRGDAPARDALRAFLQGQGIGTGIHYPVPIHLQPAYLGRIAEGPGGLAATERVASEILSLPVFPQLDTPAVDRVVAGIRAFFAAGDSSLEDSSAALSTAFATRRFVPPAPTPPPEDLPWLTMFSALRANALLVFSQRAYEEEFLIRRVAGTTRIVLNAPEAIHRVLVENAGNYIRTAPTIRILHPIIGNGLFLSEGEEWRHQRRTIAPALTPRTLPGLARLVARTAQRAAASLAARCDAPVALLAEMQHLALEIAGASMFSVEMSRHGPEMRQLLIEYGRGLGRPYLSDMLVPRAVPTWRDLRRRHFRRRWMRLIRQMIAERQATDTSHGASSGAVSGAEDSGPPGEDLLDLLIRARDPETGAAFTPRQLADQVATMIVAGHETTAVTLFWAIYLLASDPEAQQRAAAEAQAAELDPETAFDALARLPFIRAVIQESLRLYPPAFAIARESLRPDLAGGVAIPSGALILIAPWVLHRHRLLWENPGAFDPERFMPGAVPPARFSYLPFGTGPRICIGAQFALTEATLVLAFLVRDVTIGLADARPVVPVGIVTTQPDHSPDFLLRQRR